MSVPSAIDPGEVVAELVSDRDALGRRETSAITAAHARAINAGKIAHFNLFWSLDRDARRVLSPLYEAAGVHTMGSDCVETLRRVERVHVVQSTRQLTIECLPSERIMVRVIK
jgi:hypothetical protein